MYKWIVVTELVKLSQNFFLLAMNLIWNSKHSVLFGFALFHSNFLEWGGGPLSIYFTAKTFSKWKEIDIFLHTWVKKASINCIKEWKFWLTFILFPTFSSEHFYFWIKVTYYLLFFNLLL
jgi:hypothetical protein